MGSCFSLGANQDISVERNIVYSNNENYELHLDIYDPQSTTTRPAAVIIHGGRWLFGSKQEILISNIARRYARYGFFTICIDYRQKIASKNAAAVQDAKCAVRWLRSHAKAYGVDESRIIAVGQSSGGHLALMLGLTSNLEWEGDGGWSDQSSDVCAVVSLAGPTDLLSALDQLDPPQWVTAWIPNSLPDRRMIAQHLSPLYHIGKSAPPVLQLIGDKDEAISLEQVYSMHKALLANGNVSSLHVIEGLTHMNDFEVKEEGEFLKSIELLERKNQASE